MSGLVCFLINNISGSRSFDFNFSRNVSRGFFDLLSHKTWANYSSLQGYSHPSHVLMVSSSPLLFCLQVIKNKENPSILKLHDAEYSVCVLTQYLVQEMKFISFNLSK